LGIRCWRLRALRSQLKRERISVARLWRNWQTHQLEGLAVAIPWWFESTQPHQIPAASLYSVYPNKAQKLTKFVAFVGSLPSEKNHQKAP
jgi:hypothetical protein